MTITLNGESRSIAAVETIAALVRDLVTPLIAALVFTLVAGLTYLEWRRRKAAAAGEGRRDASQVGLLCDHMKHVAFLEHRPRRGQHGLAEPGDERHPGPGGLLQAVHLLAHPLLGVGHLGQHDENPDAGDTGTPFQQDRCHLS